MSVETELDRHLVDLVVRAAAGQDGVDPGRVAALLSDVLALNPARPRSYFHVGFASEMISASVRLAPDEESSRWELYGRLDAALRQRRSDRARQLSALPAFTALISDPEIASSVLGRLARICHEAGDSSIALDYVERGLALDPPTEAQSLAVDLVGSMLSSADKLLKDGKLDEARSLLDSITRRKPVMETIGYLAVKTLRKQGQCEQRAADWEEAIARFQEGLSWHPSDSQRAVLWCDIGLCYLGLASINALQKGQRRDRRAEAKAAFEKAVAAGGGYSINGAYALGVLALEESQPEKAAEFFEMAHRSLKAMKLKSRSRIEPRIRAYLAESLLLGRGARTALPKALALLGQAQEALGSSLSDRFNTYRLLNSVDEESSRAFLAKLDLSHVKSPQEGLTIGRELLQSGEPAKALEVALGLITLFLRKPDRRDALLLKLRAENALADGRAGMQTYQDLKQLCYDQEFLRELEDVLLDDGATGEILDAQERKKERLELYGLMPDRRIDRSALLVDLARSYINSREEEGLRTARFLLDEVALSAGDIPAAELESLSDRLEFEAQRLGIDLAGGGDSTLPQRMRARFSAPPRILVVGGNEKQMGDHDSFLRMGQEYHFVGEWVPANYVNPDKTLAIVRGRLQQGLKGLILLHYNRTEFGRSARKLAGEHDVVLRNLHLYGFKSLKACVEEVLEKMLKMAEERGPAQLKAVK